MIFTKLVGGPYDGEIAMYEGKDGTDPIPNGMYFYRQKTRRLKFAYVLIKVSGNVCTYQYAGREDNTLRDKSLIINPNYAESIHNDYDETS